VKEGLNLPRYPTLPGRLKSKKAEVASYEASVAAGGLSTISLDNAAEVVVETTLLGSRAGGRDGHRSTSSTGWVCCERRDPCADRGTIRVQQRRPRTSPIGCARTMVELGLGSSVTAVVIGAEADGLAADLVTYGAARVLTVHHDVLDRLRARGMGRGARRADRIAVRTAAVVSAGTDRGNEVLA